MLKRGSLKVRRFSRKMRMYNLIHRIRVPIRFMPKPKRKVNGNSRQPSGTQWHNKEDRQSAIHAIVVAKMAQNDAIGDNQKIRIVDGKDLGRYFNRSARSALKKCDPKPKTLW